MMINRQWIKESLPKTPPDTDNEHQSANEASSVINTYNQFGIFNSTQTKYVYTDNNTSEDNESWDDGNDDDDDDDDDTINNNNDDQDDDDIVNVDDVDSSESYGSDNDDINSDDELYDLISMEDPIQIDLDQDAIDTFHRDLYGYHDRTRATEQLCKERYNILCLINDIWQHILIKREFHKNNLEIVMNGAHNDEYHEYYNDHNNDDEDDSSNNHHHHHHHHHHNHQEKKKGEIHIETLYDEDVKYEPYKLNEESCEWLTPCSAPKKHIKVIHHENGKILYDRIIPSASIFGSIRTRLDCEGSDMDVTLPNSVDNPIVDVFFNKNEQKSKLTEFFNILTARISKKHPSLKNYKFELFPILNAKVPIIKMKETAVTKIEMDIAIQSSQQSVANLVNFYCDYDDRVRPFIVAIKHWSKIRGLCDAMNNYPNSFGFVLLCIKYLQMVNIVPICCMEDDTLNSNDNSKITIFKEIDKANFNTDTLLELMIQFFEMYHRFNFKLLQVSTSRIGLESKICHEYYNSFKYAHQTTMVVEDPSCRSANVTRNVRPYRLTIMQNEFFRGYKCTKYADWTLLMTKYTANSEESSIFNIYPPSDAEQEYLLNQRFQDNASTNTQQIHHQKEHQEEDKKEEEEPPQSQPQEAKPSTSIEFNEFYPPEAEEEEEVYFDQYENDEAETTPIESGQYDDAEPTISTISDDQSYKENENFNNIPNMECIEEETVQITTATDESEEQPPSGYPDTTIPERDYVINDLGIGKRGRGRGRGKILCYSYYPQPTDYETIHSHDEDKEDKEDKEDTDSHIDNDGEYEYHKIYHSNNFNGKILKNALKLSPTLVLKLDHILENDEILLFWKLTPFKTVFNVQHINLYLNQYQMNLDQFVRISKFYIIQFNFQFMNHYHDENHFKVNDVNIFKILQYQNIIQLQQKLKSQTKHKESIQFEIKCLENFEKYNNDHHFNLFLQETQEQKQQNQRQMMPHNLMLSIKKQQQQQQQQQQDERSSTSLIIYNYSYYASFILLFSFWKCLFDVMDENNKSLPSQLSNKEWIISKIKYSMSSVGIQNLTQSKLFKLLK